MMANAHIEGGCVPAFAPVRAAFARCFMDQGETGAAACVYLDGSAVVDLWGGVADPDTDRPWTDDTLVNVFSVSKPFAAVCLLHLVEQGCVDLDAPVARYWPEFGQAGKDRIPVRWLLTHQAGLLGIHAPLPGEALFDWERITAALAEEVPWWEPGTGHGEQALFFGHLVGEVVRRVSGRSLGAFLRDDVVGPWGLDFHIGLLPSEAPRCATLAGADAAWRTKLVGEPESLYALAMENPPGVLDGKVLNSAAWRRAEIPAVNGHGSAHAIARFYAGIAADGELEGVRLLSAALVEAATSAQSSGDDILLGRPVDWGLGFQIDSDGFGMGGIGGSLGWGNRAHRFGFGYVTNQMGTHDRALAVYAEAARIAGFEAVV